MGQSCGLEYVFTDMFRFSVEETAIFMNSFIQYFVVCCVIFMKALGRAVAVIAEWYMTHDRVFWKSVGSAWSEGKLEEYIARMSWC